MKSNVGIVMIFAFLVVLCNYILLADALTFEKKIVLKEVLEITKIRFSENLLFGMSVNSIIAFDENGNVLRKYGRKGKGPGDFNLLGDFYLTRDEVIGVDVDGIVNEFSKEGGLIKSYKLSDKKVKSIFLIDNKQAYLYSKWIVLNKKLVSIKNELKIDNEVIFSVDDESKLNPYNPAQKGKMPFPWFPAPFAPAFSILKIESSLMILDSKDSFFTLYSNGATKKIQYKFNFPKISVTEQDKKIFFSTIEVQNNFKLHEKTKEDINFPKIKNSFFGAIKWENNVAVFASKNIYVFDLSGNLLKKIQYESNKTYESLADFSHYPDSAFVKNGRKLYQLDSEFNVNVFQIR